MSKRWAPFVSRSRVTTWSWI